MVEQVKAEAARLGLTVSQFMNMAVDLTLAAQVTEAYVERFRHTRRAKRSDAGA